MPAKKTPKKRHGRVHQVARNVPDSALCGEYKTFQISTTTSSNHIRKRRNQLSSDVAERCAEVRSLDTFTSVRYLNFVTGKYCMTATSDHDATRNM